MAASGVSMSLWRNHQYATILGAYLLLFGDNSSIVVGDRSRTIARLVQIVLNKMRACASAVIDDICGQNVLLLVNVAEVEVLLQSISDRELLLGV